MSKRKEAEHAASEKFQIIAPLLDDSLDRGKFIDTKKQIALKHGISERSVTRYYAAYKEGGFKGLEPSPRQGTLSTLPDNYPEIVSAAIVLRKESAHRSVRDIIKILELEVWFQRVGCHEARCKDICRRPVLAQSSIKSTRIEGLPPAVFRNSTGAFCGKGT